MNQTSQPICAWGLELAGDRLRLVKLVRSDGRLWVADRREWPVDAAGEWPANLPAPQPWPVGPDEPLAVCLCDRWVFHRSLDVPSADAAALRKIVLNQLEAMLPAQAGAMARAWRVASLVHQGRTRVVVSAARKEHIDRIAACCGRWGSPPWAMVPSLCASAALAGQAGREPLLVVLLSPHCCGAAVIAGGEVLSAAVFDQALPEYSGSLPGSSQGQAPPGQARSGVLPEGWRFELRQLHQHLLADLPPTCWPSRCVVVGQAGELAAVRGEVAEALGLQAAPLDTAQLQAPGDLDVRSWAAPIGAALSLLSPEGPAINLAAGRRLPGRRGRAVGRRKWAWVGAWAAAAMLCLLATDAIRAARSDARLRDLRHRLGQQGLAGELAVGDYLESGGPSPAAVLDYLMTVLPPGAMVLKWDYQRGPAGAIRGAQVTLGGLVGDANAFTELLHKLSEAGKVEFKSGKPDQGKFRFEVRMVMLRMPRTPASAPTSGPGRSGRESTQPGPASRPGGAP